MEIRRATLDDLPGMVETITDAFHDDPTWSFAFPDPKARTEQYRRWWHLYIRSALRYDASWLADDGGAVAVWIPPGGVELTTEEAATVEPLLRRLVGDRTALVLSLLEKFDNAYPQNVPYYYLTLLGTRSDRRGEGLGMALLRHCLARIDAAHAPAYLESTNAANNSRYESVGFQAIGAFTMPDGPTVTTMWRPAA